MPKPPQVHIPTPAEIRKATKAIQARWSDSERRARAGGERHPEMLVVEAAIVPSRRMKAASD